MGAKIKIGDYIEGYEIIGARGFMRIHKTRIIVKDIFEHDEGLSYYGRADDCYQGFRGTSIREDLGDIRVITDEKPFEKRWWEGVCTIKYNLERNWEPGQIVKRFDNKLYRIIGVGINSETGDQVIIYNEFDNTSQIYCEPRELFESLNNNEIGEQLYKFEIVK